MHVGSKIIVAPFAKQGSSSGTMTMKLNEAATHIDMQRAYTSFPYMSLSAGGDATSQAYKFAPIECSGFNSAIITPFATTGTTSATYVVSLIHSDQNDGGTPRLYMATTLHSVALSSSPAPFPTTLTAGSIPDELYGGVVTDMYFCTKAGTQTKVSIDLMDGIFGTASATIGSTSIPQSSVISFLGGASHLALTYTAAGVPANGRFGFIVTLTE